LLDISDFIIQNDTPIKSWNIISDIVTPQVEVVVDNWFQTPLVIQEVTAPVLSDPVNTVSNTPLEFQLWDSKSHLKFSKPVQVSVDTNLIDWSPVVIWVMHEWDTTYWTQWITMDANSLCENWVSSFESAFTQVIWNKIDFYICWASSFTITPTSGSVTITMPWSWTTYVTQFPWISGTWSVSSTWNVITLAFSWWATVWTAIVMNGMWTVAPSSPLW
jgi:hypothetical protein